MKSLKNVLCESITRVDESGNMLAMVYDHDNPDTTYIISNCGPADIKKLENTTFCVDSVTYRNGYVMIYHNDESGYINAIKPSNENAMKAYAWSELMKSGFVVGDDTIEDFELPDLGYYCPDIANGASKIKNANNLWKAITDGIETSSIDGDSSGAYAIINPSKRETLYCGEMSIKYTDFDTFYEEMFEE